MKNCIASALPILFAAILCVTAPCRASAEDAPGDSGVVLGATETMETLGVVDGGAARGAVYEGRLELDLDLDLQTLLEWDNTALHVNAYQIHGRGLSGNYLAGNILTASNIEATRALRLFDFWVQTGFLDNSLSLRLGEIAADDEFFTSQYSGVLINATFGWPAIMAQALPDGGPVYPLATPGVRIKAALGDAFSVQMAVFNGDPTGGPGVADPQIRDPSGTSFNLDRAPFVILEAAYAPPMEDAATNPASDYKIGVWYHADRFDDLAGDSGRHQGDFGGYAVVDQLLYRETGSEDRGLGAFLRLGLAPGDRNFIQSYADAGLSYKGPLAGRDDDVAALGLAYAGVSDRARHLDAALARGAADVAIPDGEAVIELSYQIAVAPWWSVQPDAEYIIHPTPAVIRPVTASGIGRNPNALIMGVRTSLTF